MPALNPNARMPVPPPTLPSTTAPPVAPLRAPKTSSFFTWKPLMSFSSPSHVSPTTGRLKFDVSGNFLVPHSTTASRTTPTLWVLVSSTGPSRKPDSSTHSLPVISPLPLKENIAAGTAVLLLSFPSGRMAVTPVRTGPLPTTSFPSPSTRVVWPTSTPRTSVIALSSPGVPSKGTPKSRARVIPVVTRAEAVKVHKKQTTTSTTWRPKIFANPSFMGKNKSYKLFSAVT